MNWNDALVENELTCKVLFFAVAADAVGCGEQKITVPVGTTAGDVFDMFALEYSKLELLRDRCAIAVNEQLCFRETCLSEGCTMALLPPVSGG